LNNFKGECVVVYKDIDEIMNIGLEINSIRNRTEILSNHIFNTELKNFGLALKKCIDKNVSVICIYLDSSFGAKNAGHINMLL
jgi:hypothetical protein